MYDDDSRVTSELYRLMPPRKRSGSGIREALDAADVTGPELRKALDGVRGTAPETADPAGALSWSAAPSRQLRWPWRLGRTLTRVEIWTLIVGIVGVIIAYLILVKRG